MKGAVTLQILEALADTAQEFSDTFNAILSAGYGASYFMVKHEIVKKERARAKTERERRVRMNYSRILFKLKKEGFIEIKQKDQNKTISLTRWGKIKLDALRKRKNAELPQVSAPAEKSDGIVIITFDIPEKERRKRDWLRITLNELGLKMIQKSVWMGKVKIPEEFLRSLHHLKLIECVEIFEISKTGTLKHVA